MAELRADEAGHLQGALNLMRSNRRHSYRASGVELARVPGEEKLRVRTSREGATAEVDDDDETSGDVGGEAGQDDQGAYDLSDDDGGVDDRPDNGHGPEQHIE